MVSQYFSKEGLEKLKQEVEYRTEVLRKEIAALGKQAKRAAADSADWRRFVESFYDEHAADVALALHLTDEAARAYCGEQRDAVLKDGVKAMGTWEGERVEYLVTLALEG